MSRNRTHRRALAAAAALTAAAGALALGAPSAAAGVSGPAFYVDHVLYRTVATPTDLSGTGAPESSYDAIYNFGGVQRNVAEAGPGTPGFNGGRWAVHAVGLPNGYAAALASGDLDDNGVLDAADEVWAAMAAGDLTDNGVVRRFVCTVNRVPASQA